MFVAMVLTLYAFRWTLWNKNRHSDIILVKGYTQMRALSKKGVKIHIFPAARPLLYKVREIKTHKTHLTHACT